MKKEIGYIIIAAIVILSTIPFFHFSEELILNQRGVNIKSYQDSSIGGTSECKAYRSGNQVCYDYNLGSKAKYPFAGLIISKDTFFDLSDYDFIDIKLSSTSLRKINTFYMVESKKGKELKHRVLLETTGDVNSYVFNINDFTVPKWNILSDSITKEELANKDLSRVTSFCFSNDLNSKLGVDDSICIDQIRLFSSNEKIYVLSGGILISLLGIYFLVLKSLKRRLEINYTATKVIPPNPQEIIDNETKVIEDFINTNYVNSELNLRLIRKSVKIPENKISQLLKLKYGLSYKDYINQLRLEEAKRLLKQGDLNINEVAFACGFGSIQTFNRLFKEKIGSSPTEFLKSINN